MANNTLKVVLVKFRPDPRIARHGSTPSVSYQAKIEGVNGKTRWLDDSSSKTKYYPRRTAEYWAELLGVNVIESDITDRWGEVLMNTCKGCVYAIWHKTKTGRLSPLGQGECNYKWWVPSLPRAFYFINAPTPCGGFIDRGKEYDNPCPYYIEETSNTNKQVKGG